MHSVYKYVLNGEIIYIGKSDSDLDMRLKQHGREGDNIPREAWSEIKASDIYYTILANSIMSDVVESELIRRYKPKWNTAKKETAWSGLPFQEPEWIIYSPKKDKTKKTIDKSKREKQKMEHMISDLKHNQYPANLIAYIIDSIIDNKYEIKVTSIFRSVPPFPHIIISCPPWYSQDDFPKKSNIHVHRNDCTGYAGVMGVLCCKNGRLTFKFAKDSFRDNIIENIDDIVQTAEYVCSLTGEHQPRYIDLIKEKRKQFEVVKKHGDI